MDPTYPLVPVANLIALLLILVSFFTSALRSWNTGVHLFAIWVAIQSFIRAVNSIIWSNTSANVAPVWCDISKSHFRLQKHYSQLTILTATRIDVAASVGLSACSLVITRRLFLISQLEHNFESGRNVSISVPKSMKPYLTILE